jgi:hypothetical protein
MSFFKNLLLVGRDYPGTNVFSLIKMSSFIIKFVYITALIQL